VGKKYVENHYYICNKVFSAEEILSITSGEWGVEAMHSWRRPFNSARKSKNIYG
jgi:hypothetical protein